METLDRGNILCYLIIFHNLKIPFSAAIKTIKKTSKLCVNSLGHIDYLHAYINAAYEKIHAKFTMDIIEIELGIR